MKKLIKLLILSALPITAIAVASCSHYTPKIKEPIKLGKYTIFFQKQLLINGDDFLNYLETTHPSKLKKASELVGVEPSNVLGVKYYNPSDPIDWVMTNGDSVIDWRYFSITKIYAEILVKK